MRLGFLLPVLAILACRHVSPDLPLEMWSGTCAVTSRHGPHPAGDAALGFSALDVLAALDGVVDVDGRGNEPFPDTTQTLRFTFSEPGPVFVDDWSSPPKDRQLCLVGPTLTFPAVLEVTGADGSFSGLGAVVVRAQGTGLDRIWVQGSWDVEADAELEALVRAWNAESAYPCPVRSIRLYFSSGMWASIPWSAQHGGLGFHTCTVTGGLYDFVPAARQPAP